MLAVSAAALVWAVPFAWMAVASLRPGVPPDIASLTPAGPFALRNFAEAWSERQFSALVSEHAPVCGGILAVQLVTVDRRRLRVCAARLSPDATWCFRGFCCSCCWCRHC